MDAKPSRIIHAKSKNPDSPTSTFLPHDKPHFNFRLKQILNATVPY